MRNPSKSKNNPLKKNIISESEISSQKIDLSDIPDFLHPEYENSELYIYLTQRVNWPYYSLQDIYEKQNKDLIGNKKYKEWLNEIVSIELDKKNKIINNAKNYNSKLLIESVRDYMVFLSNNFFKRFDEKIRTFIFLEYFLKKLEHDNYIRDSDEFCKLYKLYYSLCRDAENIFDYLEKKEIFLKNELYYYEKGQYYERIHKHLEANQTYIEGFINILDESNPQKGKILQNNYINFEKRMTDRIERDLESLNEEWNSIDQYIKKLIKDTKENEIKNVNINLNSKKKYFLQEEETNEKFLERKLIKSININFSLSEGHLTIKNPEQISKGIEIIGVYGNVKYINSPPDINKVTSITCIYELLKKVLKAFFPEWKKDYENFDLEVKKNSEKLAYSWINKQRPTQTNIKNMNDNNTVLNLVQKEYLNLNTRNDNKEELINNNNNKENNIKIKDENENKENDHEISNMLSNIGLILDKKDSNPINININNNNIENIIPPSSIIEKDNKTLIANMQYQMEHPYENKSKTRIKNINNENNNKKIKKKSGIKTNKFKCVGKLNFDQNGLMIINLENDTDKKIDIMQSASKLLLNNDQEKKNKKKYTIVLNNAPRRIKYIKEKTILEKKDFEIRKKEMLQGVNFDYLNSFKKLFETYPQLNNLVDSNQQKIGGVYDINLEKNKNINKNNNLIEETNIQRQNGPSDAMKLLLEVYGIPQNFLEENNPFMEYAKKNGINSNFAFENLFKDMQSYINKKNSKKNNLINKNSKKNIQDKENIDADGDLIIESESDNDSLNDEKNKKKSSKHCVFDSKKNSQIVYLKSDQNENKDEVGKIIDNINKKAEKGIKIGEKTIFSNYKGVREHNVNNNNNKNLIVNQSIQLSIKKEKDNMNKMQDEINKRQMIINNSKISTKVFMSAFNYDLSNKNNNIEGINSKKRSKSKKNRDIIESSTKQQNLSNSLMIENNFEKNNFMTESNYSKTKKGKIYGQVNNEFRINNYKKEKENQLSNIKESVEREKSSKIDKNENSDEIKEEESDDKNKKNKKGNLGVIGNIRDLDNFDDLFK